MSKTNKKTVCVSAGTPEAAELEARLAAKDDPNPEYLAALAGALELAEEARVSDLARALANPECDDLVGDLLCHELAACHRLTMRFGAMADQFLSHTSATIDPDRRQVGRDAIGFAAIAARLMARYRQGALALFDLCGEEDDGVRKIIVDWGADTRGPDDDGAGGSGPGNGEDPSPAGPAGDPAGGSSAAASSSGAPAGDAPLRRGRLRNGNPSGDYLSAPRCGAKTRAGCACRQPAMRNGRCRLHGGKSTGARTAEGRRRARTARLVHGRRTAAVIGLRSAAAAVSRRLAWMTELARNLPAGHGVDRSDSKRPLGGGGPHASPDMISCRGDPVWSPEAIARRRATTLKAGMGRRYIVVRVAPLPSQPIHQSTPILG
jgi:hypothetical protein